MKTIVTPRKTSSEVSRAVTAGVDDSGAEAGRAVEEVTDIDVEVIVINGLRITGDW
jgi:hypothetical protein